MEDSGADPADPGDIESVLRSLMQGEFSSLHLSFNDLHACNYMTAQQWADDRDEPCSYNDLGEWVSSVERERAVANNSVWRAQWYPNAPVGFCVLMASSLQALIGGLAKEAGDTPATRDDDPNWEQKAIARLSRD